MGETRILYNSEMLYHLNYSMGVDYMQDCGRKLRKYIDMIAKNKKLGKEYKMFITCHNVDKTGRTGYMVLNGGDNLLKVIARENFYEVKVYKVKDKLMVVFIRDYIPVQTTWVVEFKRNIVGLDNMQLIHRWVKQNDMRRKERVRVLKS